MLIIYWCGICFELLMSYYYNIYTPNMFMALFHGGFLAFYITMLVKHRKENKPLLNALKGFYKVRELIEKENKV